MSLSTGTQLGPYEILALIEPAVWAKVYSARDTRLNRSIAIKVSAAQFSERFEREARGIAALNHPHLCALYDVGPDYLVMELVAAGPIPLEEALAIVRKLSRRRMRRASFIAI